MKEPRLSQNFKRSEFSCDCGCGFDTVDFALIEALEELRAHLNHVYGHSYIQITGPNRCERHNKRTKGAAENSQHIFARAADFKAWMTTPNGTRQIHPDEIACYLEGKYPDSMGIGRYNGRTHLDSRSIKARWDVR